MASSFNNRHWPSMFRSKHAVDPWQAQAADITGSPPPPPPVLSAGGNNTYSGYAGGEVMRTSDPKPRWNPRPEQIRILEAIFNSGMVNPPRDEIPRIRMRLQEYGHVADANVFYWFQNRKARSKNKNRYTAVARPLPAARSPPAPRRGASAAAAPLLNLQQHQLLASSPVQAAATSSSSSSSDRSSGSSKPAAKRPAQGMSPTNAAMDLLGPLAAACPQQMYYQGHQLVAPTSSPPAHKVHDLVDEAIFHPWPQGCCLSAAEVAAILGGQYMQHVPVVQQPQPPAAGAFLGLCNGEVTGPPAITAAQRTYNLPGAVIGQYGPGADHHQISVKNTGAVANAVVVSREEHDDATKLGLLQYCFGDSTDSVAATSATPETAVTVASVVATTAGLTGGLPVNSGAANGVIANYDLLQLQGLAADGALGVGVGVTTTTTTVAAAPTPVALEAGGGIAALCIADSVTGRSVAHSVAAARLDVRAQFGEGALLFRCAGERGLDLEPVLVDESSGCTVQPLQHGAFYYLVV